MCPILCYGNIMSTKEMKLIKAWTEGENKTALRSIRP